MEAAHAPHFRSQEAVGKGSLGRPGNRRKIAADLEEMRCEVGAHSISNCDGELYRQSDLRLSAK
jgi:hypothetical protein